MWGAYQNLGRFCSQDFVEQDLTKRDCFPAKVIHYHNSIRRTTILQLLKINSRSTRYETERWDSPIEGFVFRIWFWNNSSDTFTYGKSLNDDEISSTSTSSKPTTSVPLNHVSTPDDTEEVGSFKDSDYTLEDDNLKNQGSPYDWISNMVPFGHPSLGGRLLLALSQENDINR